MSEKVISYIGSKFKDFILSASSEKKRFSMNVKPGGVYDILSSLKDKGFNHLSDVTCVDYPDDREFEVIYHLWSHSEKLRGMVKVRIPRDSPSMKSIVELWEGAQIHERENHELFGIDFQGNPNLSPLFLEDWEEIPPFRKDFDSREFVRRKYYGKE